MKTRITKWSLIGDLKKYWQYRYERKRFDRSSLGGLCWIINHHRESVGHFGPPHTNFGTLAWMYATKQRMAV